MGEKKKRKKEKKVLTCLKMVLTSNRNWIHSYDSPLTVHTTTAFGDCTSCFARSMIDCIPPNLPALGRIDY
jgi:hypothetical protein